MTQGELKKTRKLPNLYTFMQTGSNSEANGPRWQTDPENPMLGPNGQLWDACERLKQFVYSPSEALTFIFVITLRMIYPLPSGWMQTSLGQSRPLNKLCVETPLRHLKKRNLLQRARSHLHKKKT